MFARVRIESLKFVRIDGAQHPRRENALKQAADPACAVPVMRLDDSTGRAFTPGVPGASPAYPERA